MCIYIIMPLLELYVEVKTAFTQHVHVHRHTHTHTHTHTHATLCIVSTHIYIYIHTYTIHAKPYTYGLVWCTEVTKMCTPGVDDGAPFLSLALWVFSKCNASWLSLHYTYWHHPCLARGLMHMHMLAAHWAHPCTDPSGTGPKWLQYCSPPVIVYTAIGDKEWP